MFTNLVDNAIKHTPEGGEVRLSVYSQGNAAEIAVSDTGSGIPPEEAKRVFERFYQVDKSRKAGSGRGSGLGLPIAKQIVQAHNGVIDVESKPGVGSTFIVRLPLAR